MREGGSERGAGSSGTVAGSSDLEALLKQLEALLRQLQGSAGQGSSGKNSGQAKGTDGGSGKHGLSRSQGGVSDGEGTPVRAELGNSNIPPPVDNLRTVQLGNKTLTVGGDGTGTANAAEVEQTAQSIQNLYQNSPSFRQMIDQSPHQNLEVSVGRRGDNTSWGGGGSVYMNLNNLTPGSGDTFQEMLAHEFAHAAVDMPHGSEQDALQDRVAAEA